MIRFDARVPTESYGHFRIGPVNWSGIVEMDKIDRTHAASDDQDQRDEYQLVIVSDVCDPRRQEITFQQDYELRDKVYDLIVEHQTKCLKSYGEG